MAPDCCDWKIQFEIEAPSCPTSLNFKLTRYRTLRTLDNLDLQDAMIIGLLV
jgi:hypothetical protein